MTNHKTDVWKQALARLIEQLMQFWPEDTWLVEKHLSALHQEADPLSSALTLQKLRTFIGGHPRHPYASLGSVSTFWTIDDDNTRVHIPFRIGQVFRHKRQNWYGVITAWYDLGVISMPEYNKDGVLVYRALRPPIDPTLSNRYLFRCL
ncbi:hypothetical protein ESCO_002613 [Escovopsis weberi]|uniref:Hemimethylated DNA-binding domain-containing protein n=1 Tax=Escovopsis weberi TaxID=150374 RepID=A0A0M8N1L6_ESCWE|nr:hypothetical protein ESCO_002613 [Escovopsis weberi]